MQMQMKFATYKLNAFLFLEIEIEKLMHKMLMSTFNHFISWIYVMGNS